MGWMALSSLGSEIGVWTFGIAAIAGFKCDASSLKKLASPTFFAILLALIIIVLKQLFSARYQLTPWSANAIDSLLAVATIFGNGTASRDHCGSKTARSKLSPATSASCAADPNRLILVPCPGLCNHSLDSDANGNPPTDYHRGGHALLLASVAFSELYDGDSDFAAASILTTTIVSAFTIPIWLALFGPAS